MHSARPPLGGGRAPRQDRGALAVADQLEVEAAGCYEELEAEKERSKVLEAKIVEICGDEDAVANVLVAENRRRRLESITATSAVGQAIISSLCRPPPIAT